MEKAIIKITVDFEIETDDLDELIKSEGCDHKVELETVMKANFKKDFFEELAYWDDIEPKKVEVKIV